MAKQFFNLKLRGIKAVKKNLNDKVKKVKKGLRMATRQAASVIQKEAQALAPVRTGALRKGIIVRKTPKSKRGSVSFTVSLSKKVWYGSIVESGHKAVNGRFVKGKPFMSPAFDAKKEEAASIIVNFVKTQVMDK